MTKYEDFKRKLHAVELLRGQKTTRTYRELSDATGLPIPVLSRYVSGKVLPKSGRAEQLIKLFESGGDLKKEINNNLETDSNGIMNVSHVVSNTPLLEKITLIIQREFPDVDKVLTVASDGIPLASILAQKYGKPVVYGKRAKEPGVRNFLETTTISPTSANLKTFYIPGSLIKKGDRVLFVDDVVRNGKTTVAMYNLVKNSAKAEVVGCYYIICIGEEGLRKVKESVDCPVKYFVKVQAASE
jgi:purine operon repressor